MCTKYSNASNNTSELASLKDASKFLNTNRVGLAIAELLAVTLGLKTEVPAGRDALLWTELHGRHKRCAARQGAKACKDVHHGGAHPICKQNLLAFKLEKVGKTPIATLFEFTKLQFFSGFVGEDGPTNLAIVIWVVRIASVVCLVVCQLDTAYAIVLDVGNRHHGLQLVEVGFALLIAPLYGEDGSTRADSIACVNNRDSRCHFVGALDDKPALIIKRTTIA